MKEHEWTTTYTPSEILSIISANTKPLNFSNSFLSDTILSKIKNQKVHLIKTGLFGMGRGQKNLVLTISSESDITKIKGKFYESHIINFIFICFVLFLIFHENFHKMSDLVSFLFFIIIIFLLFPLIADLIFKNENREIIEFVESKLINK